MLYHAPAPSNNLNIFGIKIVFIGNVGQTGEKLITQVTNDGIVFKKLFYKDNILKGAILFNDVKNAPIINKQIEEGNH